MQLKNRKRAKTHIIILTSDAVDAKVRQIRIRSWVAQLIMIGFCILLGTMIGYVMFQEEHKDLIWDTANESVTTMKQVNQQLMVKNQQLENQITDLNNQVQLLSSTVSQKVKDEGQMKEQLKASQTPTTLPLTGSASVEIKNEDEPMCLFKVTKGTLIVNTAEGVVTEITEDETYGTCVTVDHQNGFVTVYKSKNNCMVKQGDYIYQGSTLFIVEEKESILAYQVQQDGVFVDPMSLVEISG